MEMDIKSLPSVITRGNNGETKPREKNNIEEKRESVGSKIRS